jgi:hypothetical protein
MPVPSNQVFVNGSQTPVSGDQLNSMIQGVANVAALRSFTGTNSQMIWLLGTATTNDGGQSMYYYNSSSTASDNGGSVIAPSGSTQGRWIQTTPFVAPGTFGFEESTIAGNQSLTSASTGLFFVATGNLNITLPLTTGLTNKFNIAVFAQGGTVTLVPNAADQIDAGGIGNDLVIQQGSSLFLSTDAEGNWWTFFNQTRTVLSQTLNLYVSPTGSDANNGLSAGAPFQTLQHAWNVLESGYDVNGQSVNINMADGTYTSGVNVGGKLVGQQSMLSGGGNVPNVRFLGDTSTPANCIINVGTGNCFNVSGGGLVRIDGMTLIASSTSSLQGLALFSFNNGYIYVGASVVFGACGNGHMTCTGQAVIAAVNNYTISGGAPTHASSGACSLILIGTVTVTLTGTPAFSTCFAIATTVSTVEVLATFSGSATGVRYIASFNGVVYVNGAGATYLPGNSGGSTSNGGQYG